MHPPIPPFVRWTVVFAVIAALTVAVFQYWDSKSQSTAGAAQAGWTQTEWGPLGPADRDLLIKVRQAGLWEGPTGQQAQQQAGSARVREVGGLLAAEHAELDEQVRDVSARLGVLLPNQPSSQQQAWMAEIAGRSGSDYDQTFVQLVRAAHGKVLPVIAEVRSGTKNELIRSFATTAAQFVTRHHEYLESTGLVDFSALPEPPAPDAAPPATVVPPAATAPAAAVSTGVTAVGHQQHVDPVAQASSTGGAKVMVAGLVYVAALLAIVGLLWLLGTAGVRARQSRRPLPRTVAEPAGLPSRPRHAAQR